MIMIFKMEQPLCPVLFLAITERQIGTYVHRTVLGSSNTKIETFQIETYVTERDARRINEVNGIEFEILLYSTYSRYSIVLYVL